MSRFPQRGVLAAIACCGIACSPATAPTTDVWVSGGLSVLLRTSTPDAHHIVGATVWNRTGGRIRFGPPACGIVQVWRDNAWQFAWRAEACIATTYQLEDGQEFDFTFPVPETPGKYRLVVGATSATSVRLTVGTESVTVP